MVEKVILAGLEPAIFGSNALSIRPQSHVTDGCEVAGALLTFMERTRRTAARSRCMSWLCCLVFAGLHFHGWEGTENEETLQ